MLCYADLFNAQNLIRPYQIDHWHLILRFTDIKWKQFAMIHRQDQVEIDCEKYSRVWNRRRAGNKRRAWKIGQKE